MTIDSRQLRYFVEVATLGSINKASERLYIAQPALSRRMRQLEYELGVDLFIRSPGGVQLTREGRKLLGRAAALGEEFRKLRETVMEDTAPPDRELHIGMVPGPSLMILNRLVAAYHKKEPESLLQVVEGTSPVLRDHLISQKLQIAIVTDPQPHPLLEYRPLWSEALYLLSPIATQGKRHEIMKLPFVVPSKDPSIVGILETVLEKLDMPFKFDLEISAVASVKHLIAGGNACSVLPYSAIAEDRLDMFAMTRVPDLKITRALGWLAQEEWTPSVATVVELIEDLRGGLAATDRLGGLSFP